MPCPPVAGHSSRGALAERQLHAASCPGVSNMISSVMPPSSGLAWRHGPSDRMVSLLASSRAGQPSAMSGDNNRRQASS
ncbi:hypothetical protein LHGZ1_3002 [Laribacter hongkongensis]|uniref:Uncharacterized protein n=1 Tax=Laribacter hongkongensis TaxID=168471 RepID=A0A248LNS1_9NEIS|nr:hypothetical protein LHGZ1_3002 [Laribacter hongkongensis]